MIPRKAKSFYPEIAESFNLSEDLIEAVIDFYWKEIKKQLTEPEHLALLVENLGTFEVRRKPLERQIERLKGLIKHTKTATYGKHVLLNINIEKLARLEKLLELCNLQDLKKQQVREKQKNGNI